MSPRSLLVGFNSLLEMLRRPCCSDADGGMRKRFQFSIGDALQRGAEMRTRYRNRHGFNSLLEMPRANHLAIYAMYGMS